MLTDDQIHDQDRRKYDDRRESRYQDGTPDLSGTFYRAFQLATPHFSVPKDVFQYNNGGIDHHTDGEGDACQRYYVD